jgi:hypothetical protein
MGTTLSGLTPATTFDALIKVGDNSALSASLKTISDGEGNDSPLKLSTSAVGIGSITNVETEINGKQATLVSGTNIKTINSTSLLGSGDISISASAGGSDTQIQFNDSGAFGADSLFNWDNTNKRLGVGETTPTAIVHIKGEGSTSATTSLLVQNSAGTDMLFITDNKIVNARENFRVHHNTFSSRYMNIQWGSIVANDTGNELSLYGGGYSSVIYLNGSTKSTAAGATGIQSTGVLIAASVSQSSFDPEDSAQLQVDSTTKGFLPPRMTTTQVEAIEATAGLVIYDTTTNKLQCYDGSSWNNLF